MVLRLHSYWAILAVVLLLIAVGIFLFKWLNKKTYKDSDFRIALFTLIVYHLQLLLGLAWYFMSPSYKYLKEFGMGETMKNSLSRLHVVEHPLLMIIAIILITVGFTKHKKKTEDKSKFSTLVVFYGISLILALIRIPWQQWLN
ncbi:MAG: hypothetical protein CR968_05990 [Flavobacteriia bacterium]|nr:MAG: hypothetical protein CR968_05990 [Flavobacteriia bacterium]